jgi:zinc/manganese transport system permease protein
MDILVVLLPALALAALMIASHTYLGLHVLGRGIVFVDLALAQVAALGATLAFVLGQDPHGAGAQLYAFLAALLAAGVFALLRRLPDKTTREVAIGCVYVVAAALAVVVLGRSSHGMEELHTLLNGNLLWVGWREVGTVALAYAVLGVLHALFYRRFQALSFGGAPAGYFWEFVFFASFALVITLAVNQAGVLLVFALLIIPAFSATLLNGGIARLSAGLVRPLLLGYVFALAGTAGGLWLSFSADLPTGAAIVSVLGLLPLVAALLRWLVLR